MPEGGSDQNQNINQQVIAPTEQEVQNQIGMAMAFDDVSLMPKNEEGGTEIVVPAVATNDEVTVVPPVITTPDYTAFIKETFGVETIEEAKNQWAELQVLKVNPPAVQEYKFENEESKKLAEAISKGDRKAVLSILETQDKIESYTTAEVNKGNADDIIKLSMQIKYKEEGLTPAEIEYKFKKTYTIPKEPKGEPDDEEFIEKHNEWKETVADIEAGKIIDAKVAKRELDKQKSTLQLPIPTVKIDEDYEAYKASNASADEAYSNVTVPAIKSLKETDVQLGFKVEDANNQMQFEVVLAPTKDDFEKARQDSLSLNQFIVKTCYDKDGKFLPQKLQRMILLEQNFDNYAQSIARQSVNEERKRVIAKEAPNGNGSKDYNVNTDKTEFQKQMEYSLS